MIFLVKVLLAASVIAFASWLSGKKPGLSGFIIALPIASIIAIAFSYLEHKNTENTIKADDLLASSEDQGLELDNFEEEL